MPGKASRQRQLPPLPTANIAADVDDARTTITTLKKLARILLQDK